MKKIRKLKRIEEIIEDYDICSIDSLLNRLNEIKNKYSKDYDECNLSINLDYSECYYEGDHPSERIISEWILKKKEK